MDKGHPTIIFLRVVILPLAVGAIFVALSLWLSGVELNGCTEQLTTLCENHEIIP